MFSCRAKGLNMLSAQHLTAILSVRGWKKAVNGSLIADCRFYTAVKYTQVIMKLSFKWHAHLQIRHSGTFCREHYNVPIPTFKKLLVILVKCAGLWVWNLVVDIAGGNEAEGVWERVLRRKFGPKRDEVTGEWRRLHNEELNDLYS